MKHIIVGTAGHIDHGKTALVKALTGIDADRLEEEKRRGITIDLGFAHLPLTPALRLGFVDVPGHERFIKNMLAGVGGIDLVLFVIAADESIKPQTREHFDICRLLGIPRGVIALTKSDLVDETSSASSAWKPKNWSPAPSSKTRPSSLSVPRPAPGSTTSAHALARVAARRPRKERRAATSGSPSTASSRSKASAPSSPGTLISGAVQKEQEVELYPAGRRLRVRGVQVHGGKSDHAVAGQRTAVNLRRYRALGDYARRRPLRSRTLPRRHSSRLPPRPAPLARSR